LFQNSVGDQYARADRWGKRLLSVHTARRFVQAALPPARGSRITIAEKPLLAALFVRKRTHRPSADAGGGAFVFGRAALGAAETPTTPASESDPERYFPV
jgi:hypothetical protein